MTRLIILFAWLLSLVGGDGSSVRGAEVIDSDSHDSKAPETEHQEKRRLVKGNQGLRIAVFGSSNAWGVDLNSRYQAYPFLLSPEVSNFALHSSGPNYPAVCAQSMLGESQMFDVVILDYWQKAPEGLLQLALRLKKRFPSALFVFIKLWCPLNARRSYNGTEMDILEWKTSLGLKDSTDYEALKAALFADTEATWYFPQFDIADSVVAGSIQAVAGYRMEFPMRENATQTIIDYLGYFDAKRHHHLSELGHQAMATSLQNIIQEQIGSQVQAFVADSEYSDANFGRGDSCHVWLGTGACPFEFSTDSNWTMTQFDSELNKFAMEVPKSGWIKVKNPFDDPRTLFLSFLATTGGWYPKAKVEFESAEGKTVNLALDPSTAQDTNHAHLTKTAAIGKVRKGITEIRLTPIETTQLPFRLVGASFTNEDALPIQYGFGVVFSR